MKILLVEDEVISLKNATAQLSGHELVVAKTCMEATQIIRSMRTKGTYPDAIITDVNVPMGESDRQDFSVEKVFAPATLFPGGLVVALYAVLKGVACAVFTDANSH